MEGLPQNEVSHIQPPEPDGNLTPVENDSPPRQSRFLNKQLLILSAVLLLVVALGAVAYYFYNLKTKEENSEKTTASSVEFKGKQWPSCEDVRQVVEDGGKVYVACLGGVLIVDEATGKVLDQITMTQGLGNSIATSLVKNNDTLYIGSQDGFTIFDLKTRKAKKISESEGLASGSNIQLADDGDYLWIGTFGGLNRYNKKTGEINSYKSEIIDNASTYEAEYLTVTPRALYVVILANVGSSGGIARFDKATNTWERYGVNNFLDAVNQNSRVDFNSTAYGSGYVVASDTQNIWMIKDEPGQKWEKLDGITAQIKRENTDAFNIVYGNAEKLWVNVNGSLYEINPSNKTAENVFPNFSEGRNVLYSAQVKGIQGNKIWLGDSYHSQSHDGWVNWLDTTNWQTGGVKLADRPTIVSYPMAIIDNTVVFSSEGDVWKYDATQDKFDVIDGLSQSYTGYEGYSGIFMPVPTTSKIFTFSQECGMGCSLATFSLYDWAEGSIKPLRPTDNIRKLLGSSSNANSVSFDKFDDSTSTFYFYVTGGQFSYNVQTGAWDLQENTNPNLDYGDIYLKICSGAYTFKDNKFSKPNCTTTAENDQYKWIRKVDKDNSQITYLARVNKTTNVEERVELPQAAPPYNPWLKEDPNAFKYDQTQRVDRVVLANNKIWVSGNLGLDVYDIASDRWALIDTHSGLPANEVSSFAVGSEFVWVSTGSGSSLVPLSAIKF